MKYLVILFVLLFTSCGSDGVAYTKTYNKDGRFYVIETMYNRGQGLTKYTLLNGTGGMYMGYIDYMDIIDSTGKYGIGDSVYITLEYK